MTRDQAARSPSSGIDMPRAGRISAIAPFICVTVLLAVWGWKPWEWSLVDDPDYRLNLLGAQDQHGWFGGILERIRAGYDYDRAGGQFRPFLWVYSATFYLVGPGLAHVLRLAMLLATLAGVALAARRSVGPNAARATTWRAVVWATAAVGSIRGLWDGLSFLSIMELPTVAFATASVVDRSQPRRVWWLTAAALCKSPVVGGLFALSAVQYRAGRRWLAVVSAAAGLVIVAWAREFAVSGSYTADYALTIDNATTTLLGLGRQLALPALVLLAGLVWTGTWRLRPGPDSFVLASAGAVYVLILLPWGSSSGYNLAAPAFLLVFATALAVVRTWAGPGSPVDDGGRAGKTWNLPAGTAAYLPLVIAIAASMFVSSVGVKAALDRDTTIRGVADWAESIPADVVVATNGIESADRYRQILQLREQGRPPRQIVYAAPGAALPCGTAWVVAMDDQGQPSGNEPLALARSFPVGSVYRVTDPGGSSLSDC